MDKLQLQKIGLEANYGQIAMWELDIATRTLTRSENGLHRFTNTTRIDNFIKTALDSGLIHPYSIKDFLELHDRVFKGEKEASATIQVREEGGPYYWLRVIYHTIFDGEGNPIKAIGVYEDISAEKQVTVRFLKDRQYRRRYSVDVVLDIELDLTQNKVVKPDAVAFEFLKLNWTCSYSKVLITLMDCVDIRDRQAFLHTFNRESMMAAFEEGRSNVRMDYRIYSFLKKEHIWVRGMIQFIQSPDNGHLYGNFYAEDVHEEKLEELHNKKLQETDALTQLYNERAFREKVDASLNKGLIKGAVSAIFKMSIDNLEDIKQRYGEEAQKEALISVARRLQNLFDKNDLIARVSEDTFVSFSYNVESEEEAVKKARQVCRRMDMSFEVTKCTFNLTCSVGIAFAPYHGNCLQELYNASDEAQNLAREYGYNQFAIYGQKIQVHQTTKWNDREWLVDEFDEIVYVSDCDNYNLIFMNRVGREFFGITEADLDKVKCYQLLQGVDSPCSFCRSHDIDNQKYHIWYQENEYLHKKYKVKDKLIYWQGRKARMTIMEEE